MMTTSATGLARSASSLAMISPVVPWNISTFTPVFFVKPSASLSAIFAGEGQYTTTFYAIQYNWNDSSIPQELKVEGETDPVYVYETS